MSQTDRLERDLAAWFLETAAPRTPDYASDIVRRAVQVRQRPRWTFPQRWLPVSELTLSRVSPRPLPWRAIALLSLLGLVLLGALSLSAGSRARLPAPFGPAANGLVVYAEGGDIFVVDPATALPRAIVTGLDQDINPQWSLDGTRVAFQRTGGGLSRIVIVDPDGGNPVVSAAAFSDVDPDSIAWSPDGRSVALVANQGGSLAISLVDTHDGSVRTLDTGPDYLEVHWRPTDGRQILFTAEDRPNLLAVDDGSILRLPQPEPGLRPAGFTPDGRTVILHAPDPADGTTLLDVASGAERNVDVGYGRVSHDGTRIVGLDPRDPTWLCVVPLEGGSCRRIGRAFNAPEGTHYEGLHWSPDDRWILSQPASGSAAVVIAADGSTIDPPPWLRGGSQSWQRVAP
jgi:Tol biopolymer transport system component